MIIDLVFTNRLSDTHLNYKVVVIQHKDPSLM